MNKPAPTVSLDEALEMCTRRLRQELAGATTEFDRQWLLLQIALQPGLLRWLVDAVRYLPKEEVLPLVAGALGTLMHAVLLQGGLGNDKTALRYAIEDYAEMLVHAEPERVADVAKSS